MLDFGVVPPEINSALVYAGSGSASLQAAASAWNGLAAELSSAATGYNTVITQLASDEWMGPASTSMAASPASWWFRRFGGAVVADLYFNGRSIRIR